MITLRHFIIATCAFVLAACAASREAYQVQTVTDVRQLSDAEKAALNKTLAKDMKDPNATQFHWMPVAYNSGSEKADYCAMVNGKNSYGGYTGFRPFRAIIIRNAKGEYDNGTIIRIEEDEIGSDPWMPISARPNECHVCLAFFVRFTAGFFDTTLCCGPAFAMSRMNCSKRGHASSCNSTSLILDFRFVFWALIRRVRNGYASQV